MADFLSETENSVHVPPNHDQFPVGLRVLVVDDDPTVLKIIEQISAQCHYHVTTCNDASVALNLLREKRDSFDVVISDVHMPNMDGYKFLQHVDQEFNLPVVMMSVDGSSSSVMEGIRHGACHYLIKPVHQDDIRNIWQHVVRKKTQSENKEQEVVGVLEYNDPNKRGNNIDDDAEYTCSVIDATEGIAFQERRKRSLSRESDGGVEISDGGDDHHHPMPAAKKPRFVWTNERHQQFVNAVVQLGNKAVPKKILELMNIPELTRENVASHLQKFRLHMKRKSDETQQQNGMLNGTVQSNKKLGSKRFSMQGLANADARSHVSPQTQAGLHAGNTRSRSDNHSHSNSASSSHAYGGTNTIAVTAPKYDSNNNNYPYYHPLMAVEDASPSSGYVGWEWPSITSPCRFFFQDEKDELMYIMAMQQQQQHQQQHQIMMQGYHNQNLPYYEHDFISNSFSDNNNIQPSSYMMAPTSQSQPYETFQAVISPVSAVSYNNNNYSFVGRNYTVLDQSTFSPQLNNNNSSSSLASQQEVNNNIAELYGRAAPQVLASHPTLSSRTQQQQQLHNGAVRQFHGLPHVSDAVAVPYGSGSNIDSSLHHHQGQVESHSDIDTMMEVPNAINSTEVDHPI